MRITRGFTLAARRWGIRALTLLLACALMAGLGITASARDTWQGVVVDPAAPKPLVTIQGNLVTENGKPTGFYELALCVRSGRDITGPNPNNSWAVGPLTEKDYKDAMDAFENGTAPAGLDKDADYTLKYYPFYSASAAMNINTEVLTAVDWDLAEVKYGKLSTSGSGYDDAALNRYPWGIDPSASVQGYDMPQWRAFPEIDTPSLDFLNRKPSVALDVEGDSRMYTVEGAVEDYDGTNNTALVTLSASAPDNHPVVLTKSTPLVVARFSYDLNRFKTTKVNKDDWKGDVRNAATGDPADDGFWLGWDLTTGRNGNPDFIPKTPLTWMGQSDAGALYDFTDSDELVAMSQVDQSVWVHAGAVDPVYNTAQDTYFYYYLSAENDEVDGTETEGVLVGNVTKYIPGIALPKTQGLRVLTAGTEMNTVAPIAPYTYFKNLLRLKDETLILELVNEPTFKKPTGGFGGNQILFYDWDDTLIGAMIVGDGDVRAEVNAYIEKNMVHPDLRAGTILKDDLGDTLPTNLDTLPSPSGTTDPAERYKGIIDSRDREWTYRGKYPYTVGGPATEERTDGKEYPLTNKLDYAFYRHLDAATTLEYVDVDGVDTTDRYITSSALSSDADAALYPWVYGWAVVEDNSALNQTSWTVRRDAAQVANVWTTFNVGELEKLDPAYDLLTDPKSQAVPTALPAGATAAAGTTLGAVSGVNGLDTVWPAYVDTATTVAPSTYSYKLSTADGNGYLRFADFSDMKGQMTKNGQNVLIVKAVYEPGDRLLNGGQYRVISNPYYNKLNERSASNGGAYSVQITMERASVQTGDLRGVDRTRKPAIRQDTTVDQKWIADMTRGVDHDLDNATVTVAKGQTETTYTNVDIDNGEEITFTLTLSPRQNKVDYYLIETNGYNFVSGGMRSASNYDRKKLEHTIDNYYYLSNNTADAKESDDYFDYPGRYYAAVRYDVREGTHGFVLYGTLNYLMQQATRLNRGDITTVDFNGLTNLATFNDVNLRIDIGGVITVPSSGSHQTTVRNALIAAAADCETNKTSKSVIDGQNVWDYWNYELDCAELTYHQLQYYILNGSLIPRSQSEDLSQTTFDWCHLHKNCFKDEQAADAPQSWDDIMSFAADSDTAKQDAIALLAGGIDGKIEEYTSLRSTLTGAPFASGSAFQAKIVKAVADLNAAGQPLTWANVQYAILYNAAPMGTVGEDTALSDFWWYDGGVSKPSAAANLTDLAAAAKDYYGVELKDGNTVAGWKFKLAGLEDAFDSIFTGTDAVGQLWLDTTHNLVQARIVNADGTESTLSFFDAGSYQDCETILLPVLKKALDAGADLTTKDDWCRLQYCILHPTEPWPTAIPGDSSAAGQEMAGYWWYDGKKYLAVVDIPSMFDVALVSGAGEEGESAWTKFDYTVFTTDPDFALLQDLNFSFDGSDGIDSSDFDNFKAAVAAMAKAAAVSDYNPTTNTDLWKQMQYWLIHGDYIQNEADYELDTAGYYWWKGGNTAGTKVTLAKELLGNAGFSSKINGNSAAWTDLTQNRINNYYYRNPVKATLDTTDNDQKYGEAADMPELTPAQLIAAVEALVQDRYDRQVAADPTGHYHTPPAISWLDIQHYIVTGDKDWTGALDGTADFADDTAAKAYYWWHSGGKNPNKAMENGFQKFMKKLKEEYDKGGTALADYIGGLNQADFQADGVALRCVKANGSYSNSNLPKAQKRLSDVIAAAGSSFDQLTWYQVQYAMLDSSAAQGGGAGALISATQARDWFIDSNEANDTTAKKKYKDWRPDWLKTEDPVPGLKEGVPGNPGDFTEIPRPGGEDFPILPEVNAAAAMEELTAPKAATSAPTAPELTLGEQIIQAEEALTVDEQIAQAEQEFLAAWEKLQELQALKESQEAETPAETEPEITDPAWDLDSWPTAPLEDERTAEGKTSGGTATAKPSEAVGSDASAGPETDAELEAPDVIELIPEGTEPVKKPVKTEADGTVDITVVDKAPTPMNLKVTLNMTPLLLAAVGWQSLGKKKRRK